MNRRAIGALVAVVAVLPAVPRANPPATAASMPVNGQHHHYTIGGRVRPLLFWVGNDDVGDAVVAKKQDGDAVTYALLIGSDPERAPGRLNRWGYLSEDVRGGEASVVGLMTESVEQSIEEAQANLKTQTGERTVDLIHESVIDGEARSVVTSVAVPADHTFRQVDAVLGLAAARGISGEQRALRLPAGTRPGFLSAVADLMHRHALQWRNAQAVSTGEPLGFVYHGGLYQLRATRSAVVRSLHVRGRTIERAIASQLEIKNLATGGLTNFSMTYAVDGPFAEVPLTATYRPRWWIEVNLTLVDSIAGPAPVSTATDINP
jgi:hypothetical protein